MRTTSEPSIPISTTGVAIVPGCGPSYLEDTSPRNGTNRIMNPPNEYVAMLHDHDKLKIVERQLHDKCIETGERDDAEVWCCKRSNKCA